MTNKMPAVNRRPIRRQPSPHTSPVGHIVMVQHQMLQYQVHSTVATQSTARLWWDALVCDALMKPRDQEYATIIYTDNRRYYTSPWQLSHCGPR